VVGVLPCTVTSNVESSSFFTFTVGIVTSISQV
jgi:hypothetical protein